jgi:hypothetical protein
VSIGRLGSPELIMHSILCGNLSSNAGALLPGLRKVTSSRNALESASVGILQPRDGKVVCAHPPKVVGALSTQDGGVVALQTDQHQSLRFSDLLLQFVEYQRIAWEPSDVSAMTG